MKTIKSPPVRATNLEVLSVEGIVPAFLRMGDLRVCPLFRVLDNLAIEVLLRSLFIDRCIRGVFPSDRKIVPWHSPPIAILLAQTQFNAITADTKEVDLQTTYHISNTKKEHYMCCLVRQVTTLPY